MEALGAEVRERGFTALKTNIFLFDQDPPEMFMPGFTRTDGWPELNPSRRVIDALDAQLTALRDGAGPDMDILLDLNFNFKTEGYMRVAEGLAHHDLFWVEIDTMDPAALALIRARGPIRWPAARVCFIAAASRISSIARPWTWPSSTCPGTVFWSP